MIPQVILPTPSETLRALITASGYRPHFVHIGLDKDLDDQAESKRKSSNFELLQSCETQWLCAIRSDCGADWSNLIESAWQRYSHFLRTLTTQADTTGMLAEPAQNAIHKMLLVPELSAIIRRASIEIPVIKMQQWWEAPFSTWMQSAARLSNISEGELLNRLANHLDIDERTLERWQNGDVIKKTLWPYKETAQVMLDDAGLSSKTLEHLTGWLVMAVAGQSLSVELLDQIKQDFNLHGQRPLQNQQQFIGKLNQAAADRNSLPVRNQTAPVLKDLAMLFVDVHTNELKIRDRLKWLRDHCDRNGLAVHAAHDYLWFWYSAKLAANLEDKDNALKLYTSACSKAWWRAGTNQIAILHEALCYAVGVGDKVRANEYWDKAFLHGLNNPPKMELDEQHLRRLSFEFERLFAPQKAKQRIPTAVRYVVMDEPFSLTAKELANPNRISAQADSRVRYTPLMNAVLLGTLVDVQQAIEAGANPNLIIPESGENALIMALRRAHDRKQPEILEYLLTLEISPKTANHPASSKRDTPLKIAIEMGSAEVVNRLIYLGVDVEQLCFHSPSALTYAIAIYHDIINFGKPEHLNSYFDGRVPADSNDAKNGAIFDCELAGVRKPRMSMFEKPQKKLIFEALKSHYVPSVNAARQVVMTLLENKADPNRRYPDGNGYKSLWTPTLFAAQLGELDLLKAMIKAGGNPWLLLDDDESPLNGKDALWIAVIYKRQAVIEYLNTLPRESIIN